MEIITVEKLNELLELNAKWYDLALDKSYTIYSGSMRKPATFTVVDTFNYDLTKELNDGHIYNIEIQAGTRQMKSYEDLDQMEQDGEYIKHVAQFARALNTFFKETNMVLKK